mgnify:CR=1 FL=1
MMGPKPVRATAPAMGSQSFGQLLHRLTTPVETAYGAEVAANDEDKSALQHLISEISETVLPRLLTIECGPLTRLLLHVSNRRLLSLYVVSQNGKTAVDVPNDPDEAAQIYMSTISEIFASSETVVFQKPERMAHNADFSTSCSVELLSMIAGIDSTQDQNANNSTPNNLALIKSEALAWLQIGANLQELGQNGYDEDQNLLRQIATRCIGDAGKSSKHLKVRPNREECVLVPGRNSIVLLIAESTEQRLLALVEQTKSQKLLKQIFPNR